MDIPEDYENNIEEFWKDEECRIANEATEFMKESDDHLYDANESYSKCESLGLWGNYKEEMYASATLSIAESLNQIAHWVQEQGVAQKLKEKKREHYKRTSGE